MRKAHIGEKEYVLVLLKEEGVDEFGRSKTCVVVYDDTTVHLEGGEKFWTVWIPVEAAVKLYEPQTVEVEVEELPEEPKEKDV